MNADEMTPIDTVDYLMQKAQQLAKLADHTKEIIEAYHASYHQTPTFLNCPRELCRKTAEILYEVVQPYERKSSTVK